MPLDPWDQWEAIPTAALRVLGVNVASDGTPRHAGYPSTRFGRAVTLKQACRWSGCERLCNAVTAHHHLVIGESRGP